MVDKSVKDEAERIAKEATRQAMLDPLMPYYITVAPFIEAAILQARSQAFEESAKIAEMFPAGYGSASPGLISQAIRQHSQKGKSE